MGNIGLIIIIIGNYRFGIYIFIQNLNIQIELFLFVFIIGVYYFGDVVNYIGQIKVEGYIWL